MNNYLINIKVIRQQYVRWRGRDLRKKLQIVQKRILRLSKIRTTTCLRAISFDSRTSSESSKSQDGVQSHLDLCPQRILK